MKKDFAKELESFDLTKLIADYADVTKYSDRDAIIVLTSILEEFRAYSSKRAVYL